MTLADALLLVISGGAGGLVYWLVENVPAFAAMRPDWKRYVSWLLSAWLPILAWLVSVALGYLPVPESWQGVVEQLFALLFVAFSASQGVHAALKLRPARE